MERIDIIDAVGREYHTANIENGECVEREPEYKSRMSSTENGGFGNTYIEADLTSQHVYFYKEGKLPFDPSETLEVMKIREAIIKAKAKDGEWILIK